LRGVFAWVLGAYAIILGAFALTTFLINDFVIDSGGVEPIFCMKACKEQGMRSLPFKPGNEKIKCVCYEKQRGCK